MTLQSRGYNVWLGAVLCNIFSPSVTTIHQISVSCKFAVNLWLKPWKIVWDTFSIKSYKSCAHCINVAGQQISGGNIGWISAHFMPWKRGRPSWMLSPSWGALTLHCLNWETSRLVQAICIQLITMSLVGHLAECIGWERRFNRTTYILSINISSKYI